MHIRLLPEQAQASDLHQSRPEWANYACRTRAMSNLSWSRPEWWPPWDQALASEHHRSRPKQVTSMEADPNDLRGSRATSKTAKWPPRMPIDIRDDKNHCLNSTTRNNYLSLESTDIWKSDHQRHGPNCTNQSKGWLDKLRTHSTSQRTTWHKQELVALK